MHRETLAMAAPPHELMPRFVHGENFGMIRDE